MTVLFTGSYVTVLDGNGDPVSGAKANFYEAGTTTPITTYSDSGLTTANSNPVVADAAGRLGTIFLASDDYKVVITDAEDNVIDSQDDYSVVSLSTFTSTRTVNAQTGTSYTIATTDRSKIITFSNASAIAATLPQADATNFPDGWYCEVKNNGAGTVTITPATSTLDGKITLTLPTDCGATIYSDGTNYQIQGFYRLDPAPNAQTGTSYTVVTADRAKLVTFNNASAIAVTLPQANSTTFESGWHFIANNIGAGTVTITPTTSTIDGASTITLDQNESALITSDGTNYRSSFKVPAAELVLLQTQTASNDSSIDFTSNIDSTYQNYIVLFDSVIPATDNSALYLRISTSSTFRSGATDYGWASKAYDIGGGSLDNLTDSSDSEIHICGDAVANGVGNGTGESCSGSITIPNPSNTSVDKLIRYTTTYETASGVPIIIDGVGYYQTNQSAVDGLRFLFSAGNITSGTFKLYGVS